MRKLLVLFVLAVFCFSSTVLDASWFSDATGIDINVSQGTVHVDPPTPQEIPGRIQHAIETLPGAIEGAARDIFNPAGAAFTLALRHAYGQARNGARPIPQQIRAELQSIVPDELLNDVLWNTLDESRIDLANLTLMYNNETGAITLGNIVVFDSMDDAQSNWYLWAHELFHTLQYKQMGIEAFAHAYMFSSSDMEGDATNFSNMVRQRVNARDQGNSYQQIRYRQEGPSVNTGTYFRQIQDAVKQAVPASGCLDIDDNNGFPRVTNVCNTAVWVYSYVEIDRNSGRRFPGMCTPIPGQITCEIMPGRTLPVITPRRGCMESVQFSFFSNGRNAQSGEYEGDCSDYIQDSYGESEDYDEPDDYNTPSQQMGRSCCMFNGGRCGPFWNQPAQPVGSACSCQYGNPNANGRVCQ